MASLNKVILIGRLGKDPDVTTFENGNRKISATWPPPNVIATATTTGWSKLTGTISWYGAISPTTSPKDAATTPKETSCTWKAN